MKPITILLVFFEEVINLLLYTLLGSPFGTIINLSNFSLNFLYHLPPLSLMHE